MRNKCFGTDTQSMSIDIKSTDIHNVSMTGEIVDEIYKDGKLVDTVVGHNLVVNSFLKLVMALFANTDGYTGIGYWAVGSGEDSWDDNLPSPEENASRLTNEIGRVPIDKSEIKFLLEDDTGSQTPTNIIQIKHTFDINDCNGPWREFGIFGGNATSEPNTGIMVNKRHHAVTYKTDEMVVTRTMKFTLTLS